MFGYVIPYRPELKVKDEALYRSYYCGLCKSLHRKYGIKTKFLLNYDCTFAAMLLSLVDKTGIDEFEMRKCTFKPLGKKIAVALPSKALDFTAALNVLLAYYSMQDNWLDEKKVLSRSLMLLYHKARKKAAHDYPGIDKAIAAALSSLHDIEKQKTADIDAVANASAKMLSDTVLCYDFDCEQDRALMQVLCFNIGRWIYITDAWYDREKDKKKGSYNPFLLCDIDKESVMHLMYLALANARDAYELIDTGKGRLAVDVIDNIFEYGCVRVTEQVLCGTFRRKKKGQTLPEADNAAVK